jgi:hypothetical protein
MYVLNLMRSELGSVDVRGSSCVVMDMPDARAVGGKKERNSRADRARAEKGLKRVVTSVMKRVIILSRCFFSPSWWSFLVGSWGVVVGQEGGSLFGRVSGGCWV